MSDTRPDLRAVVDNAPEVPPPAPPEAPQWDGRGLPPDCPVTPLGVEGGLHHYLDSIQQLRTLRSKDHGRLEIAALFGRDIPRLRDWWPRRSKDGDVVGWRPEAVAELLLAISTQLGNWPAGERVRGRGAWRGAGGELVLHYGNAILVVEPDGAGRWIKPGRHGDFVYPAEVARPKPREGLAEGGAGQRLLALLATWRWREPALAPRLVLGWIAAAKLAGALAWRPLLWITGDRGTGKSLLHELLRLVFGDGGMVSVSDATAAGIWQALGQASVPVAVDELEADSDNRRQQSILNVARQAASGGVILRGGAEHTATRFTCRSGFLFSSILVLPLLGQDKSRMAILELDELLEVKPAPFRPAEVVELGRAVDRRLIQGWGRWTLTLERYRQALARAGHSGRGADQFGTLLAAADLVLHDEPPDTDSIAEWTELLGAQRMSEATDDARDHERCLAHLLTAQIDPYRNGVRRSVVGWLRIAAGRGAGRDGEPLPEDAGRALQLHGLKLHKDGEGVSWLAVANAHTALGLIFKDTHWMGRSGAAGVWVQALRRVPGAVPSPKALWIGGITSRATLLPLDAVLIDD